MKTGTTYQGIRRVGGREKQREWIRGEREAALVEKENGVCRNECWKSTPEYF
jgi:hypothetical protein